MDMSKLPRLSQRPADTPRSDDSTTPAAPTETSSEVPRAAPLEYAPRQVVGGLPEAWISIAIGVILLLMSSRILHFLFAHGSFDASYSFADATGAPLAYTQSVFFWGDLAILAFAVVLLLDGVAIVLARRRTVLTAALFFTIVTTLGNLVYVIAMMATGYGVQIFSALAVAFGVYIAFCQGQALALLRPVRRDKSAPSA